MEEVVDRGTIKAAPNSATSKPILTLILWDQNS
jgi:hypothetical protein